MHACRSPSELCEAVGTAVHPIVATMATASVRHDQPFVSSLLSFSGNDDCFKKMSCYSSISAIR